VLEAAAQVEAARRLKRQLRAGGQPAEDLS